MPDNVEQFDGKKPDDVVGKGGVIIAEEGSKWLMIDNMGTVTVKARSEVNEADYSRRNPVLAFNPDSHLGKLQELVKEDGKEFEKNITGRLREARYRHSKTQWRKTILVKHPRSREELRCTRTKFDNLVKGKDKAEALLESSLSTLKEQLTAASYAVDSGGLIPNVDVSRGILHQGQKADTNRMGTEHHRHQAHESGLGVLKSLQTPHWDASEKLADVKTRPTGTKTLIILAKHPPIWARGRGDITTAQLQKSTWCIVQDPQTEKSRFKLLHECQKESRKGSVIYNDADWGKGVHPVSDRKWMDMFSYDEKLNKSDYVVKDVISRRCGEREYITVFLEVVSDEKKELLMQFRTVIGYKYEGPVRSSLTKFIKAGGHEEEALKILQQTTEGSKAVERRRRKEGRLRSHKNSSGMGTNPTTQFIVSQQEMIDFLQQERQEIKLVFRQERQKTKLVFRQETQKMKALLQQERQEMKALLQQVAALLIGEKSMQ